MIPRDVRYTVTSLPMQAGNVPAGAPAPAPAPVAALENVPSTMTAGVQAAAQVRNTGTVAAPWSISAGSGLTITPSSGTLAPGATQALALDAAAGSYTLVLSVTGGSATGSPAYITASVASPPPAPAQSITLSALAGQSTTVGSSLGFSVQVANPVSLPLNFALETVSGPTATPSPSSSTWSLGDLNKAVSATWAAAGTSVIRARDANNAVSNSLTVTVSSVPTPPPPPPPSGSLVQYITHDGDAVGNTVLSSAPNGYFWNTVLEQPWANAAGDWLDATLTPQGTTAYGSSVAVATVGQRLSITVTTLVQRWIASGENRGIFLQQRANAFPLVFSGRTDATDADRPKLTVVTTTGTFTITARCNASWATGTANVTSRASEFDTSSTYSAILQFDLSSITGTVTSATVGMTVKTLTQTGAILDAFEANPPTLFDPATYATPTYGTNANGWTALTADGSTLIATDFAAGKPTVYETFSGSATSYIPHDVARTLDTARGTTYLRAYIGNSDQLGISIKLPIVTAATAGGVTQAAQRKDSAYGHCRFYMEDSFTGVNDRVKIPAMGAQLGYWVASDQGYWQPVTGNGGVPGTGLKVIGTGGRVEYQGHSSRLTTGYRCADTSAYSDYVRVATYIYHLDQVGSFPTEDVIPGIVLKRGTWYDFDHFIGLNSMTGATDGQGNYATANADGIYRLWINGYRVVNRTNYRWRFHPEICVQGFWLDVYHGGTALADRDMYFRVNEVAVATSYIGPQKSALPSWVPATNTVAQLTVANGLLANSYSSQVAPYFDSFPFNQTCATYGGAFKNPYWGDYGCTLFGSGGHGNHNDNSLVVLEYQANQVEFKRVMDPTPYFGTGTDATTKGYNSSAGYADNLSGVTVMGGVDLNPTYVYPEAERSPWVYDYGISTLGGKTRVGSSHTYGARLFIGPQDGGAANGTLLSIWQPALNRFSQNGVVSAMAANFGSVSTASSEREWFKHSTQRFNETTYGGTSPVLTALVPAQRRVYIVTRNSAYPPRWYDLTTRQYVTGTGAGFDFYTSDIVSGASENGALMFIPSRNLLVVAYAFSGNMRLQWMDVTASQPTLGGTATLSTTIPVSQYWGAITWCPDNDRLIAFGTGALNDLSRRNLIFEIEIPTTLASTWNVTQITASGTMPDLVSHPGASPGPWQFHYGKRTEYDPKVKSIVYFENRSNAVADAVYVYRPRNT